MYIVPDMKFVLYIKGSFIYKRFHSQFTCMIILIYSHTRVFTTGLLINNEFINGHLVELITN